jgi:formylglycine-generating enzyme required for sulfatase activity
MKNIFVVVILFVLAVTVSAQNRIPDTFVRINGGTFTMGSHETEPDRSPDEGQHQVTISAFYMGKYEVTQREYEEIIGTNPSRFKGPNRPVENVTWFDALEYCNRRSEQEGLQPVYTITVEGERRTRASWDRGANGYRLPTEAEWEYACRAGTTTFFSTGSNITSDQANYDGQFPYNNNDKGTYRRRTTDVGSFPANAWGLHDMHGNVWEWCWNQYGRYESTPQTDPFEYPSAIAQHIYSRVVRGGAWNTTGRENRSAYRRNLHWTRNYDSLGFRLARNL